MDRMKLLKDEYPLDLWIIAMLYFGNSVTLTARKAGVSRDHVYKVISRSKELLLTYNLIDINNKP